MRNIDKVREEMLAAGISPEKIAIYLESLNDGVVELPVEQTVAVRPTTTVADDFVVTVDGSVCRRSKAIESDIDPWDTRR